ncbi:MAG: LacI family DNA-binding transcriptional regulator [Pygmaiobacter sp.]|nr:LacI family DNA-binding transcriptional regulator [Pygmaiobacter sp.]
MVNIKTVARLAGVSPSTVSRVLTGKAPVNEDTRAKVMDAVLHTGYSPNALAKGLKAGTSNTIALMMPSIENPIFPLITRGVEDEARRCGYTVVLCNTDEDPIIEQAYVDKLRTRWIDGFIVASIRAGTKHIHHLHAEGFPIVLLNRYLPNDTTMDVVTVDNYEAAKGAVTYLAQTGCKNIAISLGDTTHAFYEKRYAGYCDALQDAGLPYRAELVMKENYGTDIYTQMSSLLQSKTPPDAVFATSDPKAVQVLHAVHDKGLRVPQDVSVIGFDDISIAAMLQPPLTTVAQPLYQMGAAAARRLIAQIRHKEKTGTLLPAARRVLTTQLVVRGSTKSKQQ